MLADVKTNYLYLRKIQCEHGHPAFKELYRKLRQIYPACSYLKTIKFKQYMI
jgi:hypothetical protein